MRTVRRGSQGALLCLLGALAACGTAYSTAATRDAERRAEAAIAACNAQLRDGILKTYSAAAACAKPQVLAAYEDAAYPFMDLVNLDLDARQIGAARIDSGAASPAAVGRDIATLDQRIAAEQERRFAARGGIGGAARPTPPEAMLAGLAALAEPAMPPPGGNCFSLGSSAHCE